MISDIKSTAAEETLHRVGCARLLLELRALPLVNLVLDLLGDVLLGDLAPLEGSWVPRLDVSALLGGDPGPSLRCPFLHAHLRRRALVRGRHGGDRCDYNAR